MGLFKSFPFATTFAVAGFFVGFSVLFSTDFFVNYNISLISQEGIGSLVDYFKEYASELWGVIGKSFGLGVVLGAILGLGGFVMDFLRRDPNASSNVGMEKIED